MRYEDGTLADRLVLNFAEALRDRLEDTGLTHDDGTLYNAALDAVGNEREALERMLHEAVRDVLDEVRGVA